MALSILSQRANYPMAYPGECKIWLSEPVMVELPVCADVSKAFPGLLPGKTRAGYFMGQESSENAESNSAGMRQISHASLGDIQL